MEERWGRECEICAETQREMRKLNCGHELCQTCLAAVPRPQCPFCRQPFPEGSEAERMLYVGAECRGCGERTGTRDACWCLPCRQLLCCRCAVFAHDQGHPKRPAASTAALAPVRTALLAQERSSHAETRRELRQLMEDVAGSLLGAEDRETETRKSLSAQLGEAGVREAGEGEELPGPSAAEEMGTRFLRLLGPGGPSPVPPSLAERIRQRGLTAEDIATKLLRFIDSEASDAQSQTDQTSTAQQGAAHLHETARGFGPRPAQQTTLAATASSRPPPLFSPPTSPPQVSTTPRPGITVSASSPRPADSPSSSSRQPLPATPCTSGVSFSLERALSAVRLGDSALPAASDEEEEEDEVLWVIGGGGGDRRSSVEVLRWDAPSSVHNLLLTNGLPPHASCWRRRLVAVCVGQGRLVLVAEQWGLQSLVKAANGLPRQCEARVPQPPFARTVAAGFASTTEIFVKFRRSGGAERDVDPRGRTFFLVGGHNGLDSKTATRTVGAGDGTSWRQLPDLTQPRLAPQCLVHRGYLYAVGGGRSDSVQTSVERLALFALETGARWQAAQALPAPARFAFAAAAFRDRVYVTGGSTAAVAQPWSTDVGRREGTSDTLVWDGAEWSEGPPMQKARLGHSLVVWRGRLVAVGGHSLDAQRTAEALKEDGSGWEMLDVQLQLPAMFSAVIAVKP